MNILILNWRCPKNPKSGGAEIVTLQHAKGWTKAGHTVTWISSSFQNAERHELIEGITIKRIANVGFIHAAVAVYLLRFAKDYDVIIDEIHGVPFFAPLFCRTPVIAFIHEVADEIWDYMYPFPINKIGKYIESLYFQIYHSCRFWTDAPSTIQELVDQGIRKDYCTAIPCPITVNDNDSHLFSSTCLKEKNPTFLFVSRVVRMKGIEEVIKSFAFIVKEKPDAALWIVGGGEKRYVHSLQKMVYEYGIEHNVRFFGSVDEKRKYEFMSRSHILLHASVKEGWGLVILEAASVGTPAVVYNVPGLRDVVHDGQTGIVISKNSPTEMARETLGLINNRKRYATFQKNGIQWANSLKWTDVVIQSEALLAHTVGIVSV